MPARFLCTLVAVAVLAAVPATADDHRVPAEFTRTSLVLVPVHVNGRGPYHFVVDTGATTTTLDDTLATELAIRPSGVMNVVTSAGVFSSPTGIVDELSIGPVRSRSLPVLWTSLREIRRDDRRILGILGQDILRNHTAIIDYARRSLELTSKPCGNGDAVFDVAWSGNRPTVSAAVFGSGLPRSARFVLDSAANAVVIFADGVDVGGLATVSTHQASVSANVLPRVRIEVGGIRHQGPAVLVPPATLREETGLLPTASFARVCIDGPRSRATFR
jgi:hypothetical protein